jgi:hypothetical protein
MFTFERLFFIRVSPLLKRPHLFIQARPRPLAAARRAREQQAGGNSILSVLFQKKQFVLLVIGLVAVLPYLFLQTRSGSHTDPGRPSESDGGSSDDTEMTTEINKRQLIGYTVSAREANAFSREFDCK